MDAKLADIARAPGSNTVLVAGSLAAAMMMGALHDAVAALVELEEVKVTRAIGESMIPLTGGWTTDMERRGRTAPISGEQHLTVAEYNLVNGAGLGQIRSVNKVSRGCGVRSSQMPPTTAYSPVRPPAPPPTPAHQAPHAARECPAQPERGAEQRWPDRSPGGLGGGIP